MELKTLIKQAALRIPRVRRFYEYSLGLSKAVQKLNRSNNALKKKNEALKQKNETLKQKNETLNGSNRELELQLYILRGDLTRAANDSEQLRTALREAERTVEELNLDKETYLEDIRRLERLYGRDPQGPQRDKRAK